MSFYYYGRQGDTERLTRSDVFGDAKKEAKKESFKSFTELSHVFISGNQKRGLCSNAFFDDGVLFSYGRHYAMASLSNGILFINSEKSSRTTEKHKGELRYSSAKHLKTIYLPEVRFLSSSSNFDYLLSELLKELDYLLSLSSKANIAAFTIALENYNTLCTITKNSKKKIVLKGNYSLIQELDEESTRRTKKRNENLVINREARKQAFLQSIKPEIDARLLELPLKLESWKKGEITSFELSRLTTITTTKKVFGREVRDSIKVIDLPDMIRVDGLTVKTNRGADVPLNHAVRLAKKILKGEVKSGDMVGHYRVDSIDENFISIGCHKINIKEALDTLKTFLEEA